MKTSANGVALIKRFEGLVLVAYLDIAGVWTIGYGHTGPEVKPGLVWSQAQALTALYADLASREDAIGRLVTAPLNQNEFDALVSFVYNIGVEAFRHSTTRRRLNAGDRTGAADAMLWWKKATIDGVLAEVDGLKRRRRAERALFLAPVDPTGFDDHPDSGVVDEPGRSASQPPDARFGETHPEETITLYAEEPAPRAGWLFRMFLRLFKR